jgi:farnesyl diphosphate synthase
MTILNKSISQGQNLNFEQVFPLLAEDVLDIVKKLNFPENAIEYLSRMMFHNVPGGKMNRGLSVFHSFQLLNPNYSPHMKFKADILGWCVEWLQAFFLVADDIMDHSKTRRGQPCWYLVENVGNIAINDSFLLESFIYQILKKYFRQEEFYVDLLELFHEVTFQTELGQLMDLLTAPENDVDLNRFSAQKYTLPIFSGC